MRQMGFTSLLQGQCRYTAGTLPCRERWVNGDKRNVKMEKKEEEKFPFLIEREASKIHVSASRNPQSKLPDRLGILPFIEPATEPPIEP